MAENKKAFMPEDKKSKFASDMKQVGGSVLKDIIFPALKKLLVDSVTKGFYMIVYGKMPTGRTEYGYTNYSSFGGQISTASGLTLGSSYKPKEESFVQRPGYAYEKIIYTSKDNAESAIEYINSLIDANGYAKVADLFDAAGLECTPSAHEVGWKTNINPKITPFDYNGEICYVLKGFPQIVKL